MNYEEFIFDFHSITVAETINNACYVYSTASRKNSDSGYFMIEIKTEGIYSLQVDKPSRRSVQNPKYKYP